MSYGLSIDPGLSNGICLFSFGGSDGEGGGDLNGSFKRELSWQFSGGANNLARWLKYHNVRLDTKTGELWMQMTVSSAPIRIAALIVEKFTPRPHESFALTQKSVEPLRGEGVLIGAGLEPVIRWREPSQQYFMGGGDLIEKKKASREFLKLNGLHLTGKDVGCPDADDAISAELHAISWLRKQRHMPTLLELFGEEK